MILVADLRALPFAEWLSGQRWYAGRQRIIWHAEPTTVTRLPHDLDHILLDVSYTDGGAERYQLVIGWNLDLAPEYEGLARIGEVNGFTAYDAMYHEPSARHLLELIDQSADVGDLRFRPEPGVQLPTGAAARLAGVEQSNTSVVFDTEAILKIFRRVPPGANPDLELNRALARAGSPHVARLLGAIEAGDLSLAMVTEFARNSAEGWAMATGSARDLLMDGGARAREAGGDFAAESYRLGEAVASVHRTLAEELGSSTALPPVDAMIGRLAQAAQGVPELAEFLPALRARIEAAGTHPVPVQRIHGDLHLGQVLRTPETWLLIDFEGEPGQSTEERSRPDSPLRDVAGMLRSYEYAAQQLLVGSPEDEELTALVRDWVQRNRSAFCQGYAARYGSDPRERGTLLTAYELDKAVYEAAYERRHRPDWLPIPLRSITDMLGVLR